MDTGGDNGNMTHGSEENDDDDMPDLQQMVTSSDLNNSKDNWNIIRVNNVNDAGAKKLPSSLKIYH